MIIHVKHSVHPLFSYPHFARVPLISFPNFSSFIIHSSLPLHLSAPLSTQSFLLVLLTLMWTSLFSWLFCPDLSSHSQSSYITSSDLYYQKTTIVGVQLFVHPSLLFLSVISIFSPPWTSKPFFQTTHFTLFIVAIFYLTMTFLSPLTCSYLLFCSWPLDHHCTICQHQTFSTAILFSSFLLTY